MKKIKLRINKKGYAKIKELMKKYYELSYEIDNLYDNNIITTTEHILLFDKNSEVYRQLEKIKKEM